jgi:uncharacterized short protein YbdD (DUF466 family)
MGMLMTVFGHTFEKIRILWTVIRHLSGDDAYERYLRHHAAHHSAELALSREEFFRRWQDGKWKGVKRCC